MALFLMLSVLSLQSSDKSDSDIGTLQREGRLNLVESKKELDQEVSDYFERFGKVDIPFVESDSDDCDTK